MFKYYVTHIRFILPLLEAFKQKKGNFWIFSYFPYLKEEVRLQVSADPHVFPETKKKLIIFENKILNLNIKQNMEFEEKFLGGTFSDRGGKLPTSISVMAGVSLSEI